MTFRRRLTLLVALAVALAIVLASIVTYVLVRDRLLGQIDDTLRNRSERATVILGGKPFRGGERLLGGPPPGLPPGGEDTVFLPGRPREGGDVYTQVVGKDGTVRARPGSDAEIPVTEEAREVAAGARGAFFSEQDVDGVHLRVLTTPASPGAALQVARSLAEVDNTLRDLLLILGAVILGGVALAAALALLVARAALAPVAELSQTAQEVARTRDLSRRIADTGEGELGQLAASFNTMLEALDRSLGAQRQLVADASHELRTPLTSLRTNIETLARAGELPEVERRRLLADVKEQLAELSVLVADVVDLARETSLDRGEDDYADIRLDTLVEEAVGRARRHARGLTFETDLEPCLISGVPGRVDRAVANLLDNAIKWSPPGGVVEVSVAGGEVVIRDHGSGIDEEDLPHVFDRFYRAASARGLPGSGLGLAIVRQVAELHGAGLDAANAEGGGARIVLRFPILEGAEKKS